MWNDNDRRLRFLLLKRASDQKNKRAEFIQAMESVGINLSQIILLQADKSIEIEGYLRNCAIKAARHGELSFIEARELFGSTYALNAACYCVLSNYLSQPFQITFGEVYEHLAELLNVDQDSLYIMDLGLCHGGYISMYESEMSGAIRYEVATWHNN